MLFGIGSWERLGDDGLAPALLDCVLETSADSALAQRLLQSGPADAQGQDLPMRLNKVQKTN